MKIKAEKLNMTQIWKNDKVVPVTRVRVKKNAIEELQEGMKIIVRGIAKGRGFQGVVKRHGFHGGPKSHGQKDRLRAPGSIGATAPQRVMKGKKMAGHMGMRRVTVKNLRIAEVDAENRILFLRGAVPGMRGTEIELLISN